MSRQNARSSQFEQSLTLGSSAYEAVDFGQNHAGPFDPGSTWIDVRGLDLASIDVETAGNGNTTDFRLRGKRTPNADARTLAETGSAIGAASDVVVDDLRATPLGDVAFLQVQAKGTSNDTHTVQLFVSGGSAFDMRSTSYSQKAPHTAAEHHPLHADVDTGAAFGAIDFAGVPQDGNGWIPVGGMVWCELRARALTQDQTLKVEARYSVDGETITLIDGSTAPGSATNGALTGGGGWTDFLDRDDDSGKYVLGYAEIRILGQYDTTDGGTLEVEGGVT